MNHISLVGRVLTGIRRVLKRLIYEERGSAVLEVVVVISVILAVALIFNTQLTAFANRLFGSVFTESNIFEILD
ncbi:MAG: hypothetical protein EOM03_01875 [Clostridia bacterium]|nr:hypothetical protein [Clostridia bacterium]